MAILWIAGTCFGRNDTAAQEAGQPPISKPVVAISGTDSSVASPSYERITTSDEWKRVWARHLGTTEDDSYQAIMEVDFNQYLVIVIFRGEQIQVRQITIDSVSEKSGSIIIRFNELGYGIVLQPNEKPPKPERPYAFVVLPKTNKEIVLEEKIWNKYEAAHDLPPKWKERARLQPTHAALAKP